MQLEREEFLIRNDNHKLVLNKPFITNKKEIKSLNSSHVVKVFLEKEKKYLSYKMKDNHLVSENIIKGDLLIIEITNNLSNRGIGLFNINNNYLVGKYEKKESFYIIDYENIVICDSSCAIGKVIMLERNIKKNY